MVQGYYQALRKKSMSARECECLKDVKKTEILIRVILLSIEMESERISALTQKQKSINSLKKNFFSFKSFRNSFFNEKRSSFEKFELFNYFINGMSENEFKNQAVYFYCALNS